MPTRYDRAYNEVLHRARQEFIGADGVPRRIMRDMYMDFARMLVAIDRAADAGTLTSERAARLKRSIEQIMARYALQLEDQLVTGTEDAMDISVRGHRQAVQRVSRMAGVDVRVNFDSVAERALANMFARRGIDPSDYHEYGTGRGGLSGTFETLVRRRIRHMSETIDDMLVDAVAQGKSAGRSARDLALQMSRDDPALRAALERVDGGRSILRDLHAGRLDQITTDPDLRRLLYDARRIAVTEWNTSYFEANREGMLQSPVVSLVRWTVSGRHEGLRTSPCICTYYANTDHYGLGKGVFHPENAPAPPHPHCACSLEAVLRRPSEWNEPMPERPGLQLIDEERMKEVLKQHANEYSPKITEAYVKNQTSMGNRKLRYADAVARGEA